VRQGRPVSRVPSLQLRYKCLTACRDWHRFATEDYKHTSRAFSVWHVVVLLDELPFVYLVIVPLDDILKALVFAEPESFDDSRSPLAGNRSQWYITAVELHSVSDRISALYQAYAPRITYGILAREAFADNRQATDAVQTLGCWLPARSTART
jgi:hypothetical protein